MNGKINWSRLKMVVLLLTALWVNQPVVWARNSKQEAVDPAFIVETNAVHSIAVQTTLLPNQQTTEQDREQNKSWRVSQLQASSTGGALPTLIERNTEVTLAYAELTKIQQLIVLENEMIRQLSSQLATKSPAQQIFESEPASQLPLLRAMREQAEILQDLAQKRLAELLSSTSTATGQ